MNLVFLVIIVNFFFVNCLYSDFNTYYDTALKDNKIFESFRKIYLGIEMYFGKNEEKFIVELDINSFLTVIPGKEIIEKKAENIKKFDPTSSTSFKNIEKIGSVMTSGEKFYEGILGQDLIQFGDKEKIHDLKFAVANSYYLLNYFKHHFRQFFSKKWKKIIILKKNLQIKTIIKKHLKIHQIKTKNVMI